jgi:cyanophycinase
MWVRFALILLCCGPLCAQRSSGPGKGTLIVDGGGTTDLVKNRFVAVAGGNEARIVVIPTCASSIRFGPQNTVLDPDWPKDRPEWPAYEAWLKSWLGVDNVVILHTRDRAVADSTAFTAPHRNATGAFPGTGNAGRIADAYLGTRTHERTGRRSVVRGGENESSRNY